MSGYISTSIVYPCDKGIPGNVATRGWHNFRAVPGGAVCCTFCGAFPSPRTDLAAIVTPLIREES